MNTNLLIATIGGSPEPIIATLLHSRPARAIFIVSEQTKPSVPQIDTQVRERGWRDFDAGRYDIHEITNAEDYSGIVNTLRSLDHDIAIWKEKHPSADIIADITAGTKPMSAALAFLAGRWRSCEISYVGGEKRTKDGVGIVVSGTERILRTSNPADALGLLAFDTALELLRNHAYAAAETVLTSALKDVTDLARKSELSTVAKLAHALTDWDRFQHHAVRAVFSEIPRHAHNLEAALGKFKTLQLLANVEKLRHHLETIVQADKTAPSRALILDLIANAKRRIDEKRFDDATGRLYRAIEAIAQHLLFVNYQIKTGNVHLNQIPETIREQFVSCLKNKKGNLKIGLQNAWLLLKALNESAAETFFTKLELGAKTSALTVRNDSILAHGFAPVDEKIPRQLLGNALELMNISDDELPVFSIPIR